MALNLLFLIIGLLIGWYLNRLLNLLTRVINEISGIKAELIKKLGQLELLKKADKDDKLWIKKDTNLEEIGL